MMRSSFNFVPLLLLGSIVLIASATDVNVFLLNTKIDRTIDITTHIARHNVSISVYNGGSSSASVVHFAFEQEEEKRLSLLDVFDSTGHLLDVQRGNVVESTKSSKGYVLYEVKLRRNLEASASIDLHAHIIFTHALTPLPARIAQNEKQLVEYYGNHYFFSPYQTQTQVTNVKLGASRIESKSELKPTSVKGDTITYGPYEDVKPFSYSQLRVHYENNSPFLTVRKLVRTIEVSHWGNVAVEEDYLVEHTGALLKGTFSRYDYQRNPYGAASVIPLMREYLPPYATDPYYRDESGNVTTSNFAVTDHGPLLELIPRFPLFGGWKFGFYIGYNLPAYNYLFTSYDDSSLHVLNITFGVKLDPAVIDHLVVKIILPEGAKNPEAHVPFHIDGQHFEKTFTYLDTVGRPVIVLEKRNVVSDHNRFFQVTYNYSFLALLHEPFLLIGGFFLMFVGIIVWVRLEFHVGPVKDKSPEIDDLLLKYKDIVDARTELYNTLENAASQAGANKTPQVYDSEKASADNTFSSFKKMAGALIAKMESTDAETARKLIELEKKEEAKATLQFKLQEHEVNRKGAKGSKYEDEKNSLERQVSNAEDELDALVSEIFD